MSQTIICPNCNTEIDLDKIADNKYNEILKQQEIKLKSEQEKQREKFEKELEEKTIEMRKKAQEFADKKADEERKKVEVEMKDMQDRLKKAEEEQQEWKKKELEFMKKQRELEDKEKHFELEIEKKIFEERKKLEVSIEEKLRENSKKELNEMLEKKDEENRKKEMEYQKQQDQMKKTIDDLKRKAEQWSQQIQGDIQEDDLRQMLSMAFPIDEIEDVPTGIKWADLIQRVKNNLWHETWIIVWESKNTKAWTDSWIAKLKDDKLKVSWNIAILVTTVLPKWMKNFGMVDDVMITLPEYSIEVVRILREKLITISKVEQSQVWKDIKMELLYKYLWSEEFSSKISTIVDVFSKLKQDIDIEKRAMEKIWKRREKELERAVVSTSMMHWELEGFMWRALPWAEKLELWYWEELELEED